MPLADLTDLEQDVVGECLRAAAGGPFFPDWEFQLLFGLERDQVAHISAAWPEVDDSNRDVSLAINNAFVNLLGYPHGAKDRWQEFISVPPDEARRIFEKWRGHRSALHASVDSGPR